MTPSQRKAMTCTRKRIPHREGGSVVNRFAAEHPEDFEDRLEDIRAHSDHLRKSKREEVNVDEIERERAAADGDDD